MTKEIKSAGKSYLLYSRYCTGGRTHIFIGYDFWKSFDNANIFGLTSAVQTKLSKIIAFGLYVLTWWSASAKYSNDNCWRTRRISTMMGRYSLDERHKRSTLTRCFCFWSVWNILDVKNFIVSLSAQGKNQDRPIFLGATFRPELKILRLCEGVIIAQTG